jgi:hypothetical protein
MKLSTLLTLNAVVSFAFGVGFVIAPAQVLAPYGVEVNVQGLFLARYFGAALIGYGTLTWLVRGLGEGALLRPICISLAAADVLGLATAVWMVTSHAANALGWSTVAIYGFFAVMFGMAAARQPAPAPTPAA